MIATILNAIPQKELERIVFAVSVILIAYVVSFAIKKSVDFLFVRLKYRISHQTLLARTRTVRSLLKNIIDVSVFLIAILIILSRWDINIMPLLTGAGLAGLAISFGAQTLVKDLISGFFIILEDQFSVGDKVKIADIEGVVQEVTLRLTILKDKNNHLIYIPNSQITTVMRYDTKLKLQRDTKRYN